MTCVCFLWKNVRVIRDEIFIWVGSEFLIYGVWEVWWYGIYSSGERTIQTTDCFMLGEPELLLSSLLGYKLHIILHLNIYNVYESHYSYNNYSAARSHSISLIIISVFWFPWQLFSRSIWTGTEREFSKCSPYISCFPSGRMGWVHAVRKHDTITTPDKKQHLTTISSLCLFRGGDFAYIVCHYSC